MKTERLSRKSELNRWDWIALGLLVLMLPELLLAPLFSDQGIYLGIARRVLDLGQLPYLAGWDHKGPLFHLIFAGFLKLGGSFAALRGIEVVLLSGFAFGLWRMTRRLPSGPAAPALAVVFWLIFSSLTFIGILQPDLWGTYLLLALFAVLLPSCPLAPRWRYGLSGVLLGAAVLIKLPFLCFGLVPVVALVIERRGLKDLMLCGLGFMLPVLVMLGLYAAAGQLAALLDIYIGFNYSVHRLVSEREVLGLGRQVLASLMMTTPISGGGAAELLVLSWMVARLVLAGAAVAGFIRLRQVSVRAAGILGAGALAGALSIFIQQRFYDTHFFPYLLPVCVLAACGVAGFTLSRSVPVLVLLFLHGGYWLLGPAHVYYIGWDRLSGRMSAEAYQDYHIYDIYDGASIRAAVARVKLMTAPDDQVVVWGGNQLVPVLAERSSPTRFGFSYPLIAESRWQATWRAEYLAALQAQPPRLILVQKNDQGLMISPSSETALASFPAFQHFLTEVYTRQEQDAVFDYYVRRP